MTSREAMSVAFRCSVDLARAQDDLAKEKAKTVILTRLITEAADNLSNCRIATIDGKSVRFLEARILSAANTLCQALMIAGVELPAADLDGEQLIAALQLGGEQAS